jgi:hypothetical protein
MLFGDKRLELRRRLASVYAAMAVVRNLVSIRDFRDCMIALGDRFISLNIVQNYVFPAAFIVPATRDFSWWIQCR